MRVLLEDYTPYDRSSLWKLHDAYFAACGRSAWSDGAIPSYATSNYAMARQRARLLLALVAELEAAGTLAPDAPVRVLELGGGSGVFAANLLRALDRGLGDAGRRLLARVQYVFTDYALNTVRDALAAGPLCRYLDRVVPALFDLRRAEPPCALDGTPVEGPFAAVFANYVCCVSPLKVLRRAAGRCFEKELRLELETGEQALAEDGPAILARAIAQPVVDRLIEQLETESRWKEADPDSLFAPGTPHARIARRLLGDGDASALAYPYSFVDCVRGLVPRLAPGGLFVVGDYGSDEGAEPVSVSPQHYGNTLNHAVRFELFDAMAAELGLGTARTRAPLAFLQTAVLAKASAIPPALEQVFRETHVDEPGGDDLVALSEAARALAKDGHHELAAKVLLRCVRLDPESAELRLRLAACLLEAHETALAAQEAELGLALDTEQRLDFDYVFGRLHALAGRHLDAADAFARSLERGWHPATATELGAECVALGRFAEARDLFKAALEAAPDTPDAAARLADVEAALASAAAAEPDAPAAEPPVPVTGAA